MAIIRQPDHDAVALDGPFILAEAAHDSQAREEEEDVDQLEGDRFGLGREIGRLSSLGGVEQVGRELTGEVVLGARVDDADTVSFEAGEL